MKLARPGIADTDRPRLGSFASLLDQARHDDDALDGLAFAYTELGGPERKALIHAVLQDAADPTDALIAFIEVEEDPRLRQRLAALVSRHGHMDRSAVLAGTETEGEACLLQSLHGLDTEALRITWKDSKIENIEIESRRDLEVEGPESKVATAKAVEILAPLMWRRIQSGGDLPDGVERFAGFFSVG
jgi:hypothetical protein